MRVPKNPRNLDPQDISSYLDAATERVAHPSKPKSKSGVDALRAYLDHTHSVRMFRMRVDLRWLQRQCKKYGVNPEDARWLI
jgi:hypothetical protein